MDAAKWNVWFGAVFSYKIAGRNQFLYYKIRGHKPNYKGGNDDNCSASKVKYAENLQTRRHFSWFIAPARMIYGNWMKLGRRLSANAVHPTGS